MKIEERGYRLSLEANPQTGKPITRLLAHGMDPINVWVPLTSQETFPPEFVETTIKVEGQALRIGIDCQKKNEFDAFVESMGWASHLAKCVKEEDLPSLLKHLRQEVPKWRQQKKRIFAGRFECEESGTIWKHFTHWDREEIRPFCLNLETGFICSTAEFSAEAAKRLDILVGKEITGLLPISDLYQTKSHYQAKISFYDKTLHKCALKISLEEKVKMAQQLLKGLSFLEGKKWVHCGVLPSSIWLRYNGWFEVDAALSGFEAIYPVDQLPSKFPIPAKWKSFLPPECTTGSPVLSHAIPIYQLGMCLEPLFVREANYLKIIDRMMAPNPAERPTALQALALFEEDRKEPLMASDDQSPRPQQ